MNEARKYWRERLETISFAKHVALDHPRPTDELRQFISVEKTLDSAVHELLLRLTKGNPILSFTALLLGLKCCCHKYSGECDVTIFTPTTTGDPSENMLPINSTLDRKASFKDALIATKGLLSNAYKYQQYPFSRMVLDLPEARRPKHRFMSASMVGVHDQAIDDPSDIRVGFEVTDAGTRVTFDFDARIYEPATIDQFFRSFSAIVAQGLADIGTVLADARADHGEPIDVALSAAKASGGDLVHQLFKAQVANRPDGVAVVHAGREVTYAALDRLANQLAETLAELSLNTRKPVVLLMDAGVELIVGMLAVLESGAAFAMIEPGLLARAPLDEILATLGPSCIICRRGSLADIQMLDAGLANVEHVISIAGGASLEIMHHPDAISATVPAHGVRHAVVGQGTACVVIVDGAAASAENDTENDVSTSAISHAELVHLFQWLNHQCGINAGDRCLLSPGLGVCEQLYDTLGMLMVGAGVEVTDISSVSDAAGIVDRLTAPETNVWNLPTPLMQNLVPTLLERWAHSERPHGPRAILLSGEKQSASLVERLAKWFPDAKIIGLYANANIGIWSTFFPGPGEIAQAIPGFEHRVMNKAGDPAPLRTRGELHLLHRSGSRPSVSTGLRAESLGGGRLRWLRGERHCFVKCECCVELTVIEAALCEHEQILAAEVTTVGPEQATDRSVVAFVIADPNQMSAEAARDVLLLSEGIDLIPDGFVLLDAFPLTATGAIDRDALAKHVAVLHGLGNTRSVETDAIQAQLTTIWLELLQVDEVDEDDSFFARGGNSLKATLLLARIQDEFAVDLSVQKFFREPSTRAVAQLIAAEASTSVGRDKASNFKVVPREQYRVQLPDTER